MLHAGYCVLLFVADLAKRRLVGRLQTLVACAARRTIMHGCRGLAHGDFTTTAVAWALFFPRKRVGLRRGAWRHVEHLHDARAALQCIALRFVRVGSCANASRVWEEWEPYDGWLPTPFRLSRRPCARLLGLSLRSASSLPRDATPSRLLQRGVSVTTRHTVVSDLPFLLNTTSAYLCIALGSTGPLGLSSLIVLATAVFDWPHLLGVCSVLRLPSRPALIRRIRIPIRKRGLLSPRLPQASHRIPSSSAPAPKDRYERHPCIATTS
ncbi:hypothetical protein L1887_61426 [Cichorium endivia]|nr:hypothetical protein L1887_61426 [Cichorium endivia]